MASGRWPNTTLIKHMTYGEKPQEPIRSARRTNVLSCRCRARLRNPTSQPHRSCAPRPAQRDTNGVVRNMHASISASRDSNAASAPTNAPSTTDVQSKQWVLGIPTDKCEWCILGVPCVIIRPNVAPTRTNTPSLFMPTRSITCGLKATRPNPTFLDSPMRVGAVVARSVV